MYILKVPKYRIFDRSDFHVHYKVCTGGRLWGSNKFLKKCLGICGHEIPYGYDHSKFKERSPSKHAELSSPMRDGWLSRRDGWLSLEGWVAKSEGLVANS
jgi:hypothetical protein